LLNTCLNEGSSRVVDESGDPKGVNVFDPASVPHIVEELTSVLAEVERIPWNENVILCPRSVDDDYNRRPKDVVIPRPSCEPLSRVDLKRRAKRVELGPIDWNRGQGFPRSVVTPAVVSLAVLTSLVAMR